MKKFILLTFLCGAMFTAKAQEKQFKITSFEVVEVELEADVFVKALQVKHTGDENVTLQFKVLRGGGTVALQNGHYVIDLPESGYSRVQVTAKQSATVSDVAVVVVKDLPAKKATPAATATAANSAYDDYYTDQEKWNKVAGRFTKRRGFAFNAHNPKLPNVLIVGTSISIGYTPFVQDIMKGKANVYRIPENSSDTGFGLNKMAKWLSNVKWDAVHINFGLHDLKYYKSQERRDVEPKEYQDNLRKIFQYIKDTNPQAKIIWATTSYIPDKCEPRRDMGDDKLYNDLAAEVVKEFEGIIVDDQYTLTKNNPKNQSPNNVHFKTEGCKQQGEQASKYIKQALGIKK
ncbi:MAG: SGNH/GDSL hydrolase family protein [Rikenellaceae bacterium]